MNPENVVLTTNLVVGAGPAGAGLFFYARAAGVLDLLLRGGEKENQGDEDTTATTPDKSNKTLTHSWWDEAEQAMDKEDQQGTSPTSTTPTNTTHQHDHRNRIQQQRSLLWVDRCSVPLFGGGSLSTYEINSNTSSIRFVKNAWGYGSGGALAAGTAASSFTDPFQSPRSSSPLNHLSLSDHLKQQQNGGHSGTSTVPVEKMKAPQLTHFLMDHAHYMGIKPTRTKNATSSGFSGGGGFGSGSGGSGGSGGALGFGGGGSSLFFTKDSGNVAAKDSSYKKKSNTGTALTIQTSNELTPQTEGKK